MDGKTYIQPWGGVRSPGTAPSQLCLLHLGGGSGMLPTDPLVEKLNAMLGILQGS